MTTDSLLPCMHLFLSEVPQFFLPTQSGLWITDHLAIVCHQSEGKPLTNGDLVTHYFCVFHISRHISRPKEGARGTTVTFIKSTNQLRDHHFFPQTPRHFCLPQKQQLWFLSESPLLPLLVYCTRQNLSFQPNLLKRFAWEAPPCTGVKSHLE